MAQYNGYVSIPHQSYDIWRAATIGNGYNADFAHQNQCWDYPAELYFQYGLPLITRPGGNGTAKECWTISRAANSRPPFTSIEGVENIKRGDILVFDGNEYATTGHIAFADEDWQTGMTQIRCLGQNQGQGVSGPVNVANVNLNKFLGIFRNTAWATPTPPTPTEEKKKKFPWPIAWNAWPGYKD